MALRAKNHCPIRATAIFDADDTLWETQSLYRKSKNQFFDEMVRAGFSRKEVSNRFEAIDHANVGKLGFSKRRFPQSMFDTYRALCINCDRPFDKVVAGRARTIGKTAFSASPRTLAGVTDTLLKLRVQQVRLVLATKGDRELQERRIKQSGLRHFFDKVYIFPNKGMVEFEKIVSEEDINVLRGWSIGNSIKSDINPALAVGLKAIWIPRRTWIYEDEKQIASVRFYQAKSIRDVPGIILGRH